MDDEKEYLVSNIEGEVIAEIFPHLTEDWRQFLRDHAHVMDDWDLMCMALDGAYVLGYRVPEEILTKIEYNAEVFAGTKAEFFIDKANHFIRNVRSLDDKK